MSRNVRGRLAPALLLAALVAGPALGQPSSAVDRRLTPEYGRCLDRNASTAGMLLCADQEFTRQDRLLNVRYREVMRRLTPSQQATLRTAQRAWIPYRNARCASFSDEDWGSLSRVSAADCLVSMTVQRLIDLQDHPPGGEG